VRILVTGKGGKAGSWKIRGEQLGAAIGAEVMSFAEMAEIKAADIVVVVKRTPGEVIRKIRWAGKPWVYDIVDAWPQPSGNEWDRHTCQRWLRAHLADLGPTAVVFPTSRMLEDSGWLGPALVLPHHAWPKYEQQPVAEKIERIGYEGDPNYLGRWHRIVARECNRRGWTLVINGDLASCQIGLALRGAQGYPCGAWKANTKLANLQALGLPAVVSPEWSYREFGSGLEFPVISEADLIAAFDELEDFELRKRISQAGRVSAPRLADVAATFRRFLCASKYS
jgi:hypothetical protein